MSEDTHQALQVYKPPYDGDPSYIEVESHRSLFVDEDGILKIGSPEETRSQDRAQSYKDIADKHEVRGARSVQEHRES